ncbi:gamma-tubulin [Saccharomycopsis crataegensis]|uniref:Tubulin gamma chain n=1 Tax=Saccharomycopsis crataegensis TaxID=43959 RepID=A0AAV5QPM3_9ASCO|nr:gamma-tubulin [Saccharomycopsis crataegensis]
MPGEVVTIQAGQCGNQIGQEFWNQLCREHGINTIDGTLRDINKYPGLFDTHDNKPRSSRDDYPNVFFNQDDDNRFTPRGILFDLEPRVVSNISNRFPHLFNPRNIYTSASGSGAGNNWSQGYDYGTSHIDELIDIIDREVDSCDNLEGFQLIHSVAGGTGSGLGSFLLEQLADRYAKKLVQTYSVFPANDQTSDVVVQPYNTILTLKRLIEFADSCVVFDNAALNSLALANLRTSNISFEQTNQLVSTVMAGMTNPLRFPTAMYNSMSSILSSLIPTPTLHFLTPSFYPFTSEFVNDAKDVRRSTGYDVLLELLNKNLRMVKSDNKGGNDSYISILNLLQGKVDENDIVKGLSRFQQRITFVPWTNSSVNLIYGKKSRFLEYQMTSESQFIKTKHKKLVSGLMLANSSSIVSLFKRNCSQYDKLIKRNAFLDGYKRGALFSDNLQEFHDSRQIVQGTIDEYLLSATNEYLNDDDGDDDDDDDVEIDG